MRNKSVFSLVVTAFFVSRLTVTAATPLTEAHVTKIINEVKLVDPAAGDRDAKLNDVVRDEIALTTGIKSRSELLFQDRTLTRLGPESYFSFKGGTREMTLQKGTMLLQVPKGLGGAKIHTASVTAAITGTTIMMEYVPNKAIKVLVLEGTMRLSMNGKFGDSLLLTPGKMVIMSPNARRVPDPVTVDLKKVVQTSSLLNMHSKHGKQAAATELPLPSMAKIEKAIDQQQTGKNAHSLVDTNLVILGKGTNVVFASDQLIADLTARNDVAKTNLVPTPPPAGAPPPPPPGPYNVDNTTTINTSNAGPLITTQGVVRNGGTYQDLATNGSPAEFLFGVSSGFDNQFDLDNFYLKNFKQSAVFTFDALNLGGGISFVTDSGPKSVALVGNNGISNVAGSVNLGGIDKIFFATKTGTISLDSTISFGTTSGDKPKLVQFYARGGDENIGADFTLAKTDLRFAAENNAIFDLNAAVTAKSLMITALQTAQFDGTANVSSTFQLTGETVEVGGSVAAHDVDFSSTGDMSLAPSGSFTTSGHLHVDAGGNIDLFGTVTATKDVQLTAISNVQIGGNLQASSLTITADTLTVNANVTAPSIDLQLSSGLNLGAAGSIVAAHTLSITVPGAFTFNTINGSSTRFDLTNLNSLSITAQSIVFDGGLSLTNPNGDLTATGGDIVATGFTLNGFDQIKANSGSLTASAVTAKKITIGATLTAGSITADTITTNALHADNVTATKSLTVQSTDLAPFATNTVSINASTLTFNAGAILDGADGTPVFAPANAFNLAITTGDFMLASSLSLNGGNGDPLATDGGGNGGQLDLTSSNSVTINSPISATSGLNSTNAMTGGNGGTVNLTAQKTITLKNKIEVSSNDGNRRVSSSGGHITIKSNATSGAAINVNSSAQLLALLNAAAPGTGGSIKFISAGGNINMSGTAQADRGSIEITNNGTTSGNITLSNATLAADTIKVAALATNGTLNIGGGSISADTLIKLYAGGSNGTVDFVDNATLGGNSAKIIAANTVIVNNGKIVTILGPSAVDVFTNNAHYTGFGGDNTTTGTFAGKGAVTHPLSGAPGY